MKCLIFLSVIVLASARVVNRNDCEGVVVDGISHAKETIKEYVDKPSQLAMDYNNNVLYFSYSAIGDNVFALGYINLKTNEFGTVSGVTGGFANAVDEKTHTVYFGGSNGIYKLKDSIYPETKRATNLNISNKNIWQLFSKDALYFTTYPEEEAYVYKGGEVKKVPEIGDNRAILMAVDNSNNVFYSNSSGLFLYTRNNQETTHSGSYTVNGMTSDINGKIFFSTPTGIFSVDEKTKAVKELASIINIYGMAIESDGSILYASENSIIRLKSTGKECVSDLSEKKF